jgi:Kef-type K+ transport system membrane component KefB
MDVFSVLALVMGVAAIGGVAAKAVKQPPLLGYVVAGAVLALTGGLAAPEVRGVVELMGKLGVTLLLFLAGLELPISELKRMGRVSLWTGMGQIIASSILGFGLAKLLGFSDVIGLYLGVALSFGSTIMVVKLLSEKRDLQSLSGKLAVSHLLVQDFVAIGMLVVMSGAAGGNFDVMKLGWVVVKGVVMVAIAVGISTKVMGKVLDYLGFSTELLFITSIGWCLVVAAIVASPAIGFSAEIGGLLAGLAMANAAEQAQIISRVRPLRDFFLTWFFVALGANLKLGELGGMGPAALVISAAVVVVNPLIMMTILGLLGYRKRTAFLASLAVSSISEFSLILVAGVSGLSSLLTLVAIITMSVSSYLIWNDQKVYRKVSRYLRWLGSSGHVEKAEEVKLEMSGHGILFGHNRVGERVRPALEQLVPQVVVVDFNPEKVGELAQKGVKVVYGDMSDHELYGRLALDKAAIIISTVPDFHDNLLLLSSLAESKGKRLVIVTADNAVEAKELYKAGADYVLIPHFVGGNYLSFVLEQHDLTNLGDYLKKERSHG